jgi:hypothetical protein
MGNSTRSNQPRYADVDLEYTPNGGGAGQAEHRNNVFTSTNSTGFTWLAPTTTPGNFAGWKFMMVGANGANAHPFGKMTFANLPSASVPQGLPIEAMEYDIIDGSKFGFTPPTAAAWSDQVIGGGNGHYKVRYDGSVWRRIG